MPKTMRNPAVTSFAAPTPEDIAGFGRLTEAERNALIDQAIQEGIDSGISAATMNEIWAAASRRVKDKVRKSDAL